MNILVLETSTSNSKFSIYSDTNKENIVITKKFKNDNFSDHEPMSIINQLFELFSSYMEDLQDKAPKIDNIIISSTWHNLLLLDREYKPLSNSYYWNSNIAREIVDEYKKEFEKADYFYQNTGCIVHPQYPYFKMLKLKEKYSNTDNLKITDIGSYIYFLLTDNYASSMAMLSGSGFLNIHTKKYDEKLLEDLAISEKNLPEIRMDAKAEKLTEKGMKLLNLDYEVPVYLAYPDGALNQIGEETEIESMSFSIGTSSALRIHSGKPKLSESSSTWCYITPKNYLVGGATSGASNCVDWIKAKLFPDNSYEELLVEYDPSKEYPVFLPFLFGERSPGWDYTRNAAFFGIDANTSEHDLYYSVLEGVVFNAYQTYLSLVETNKSPETIRLSGGFASSQITAQMCCDIFGRDIILSENAQQSMLGGVKLVYMFNDLEFKEEVSEEILKPELENVEIYKEKFERYLKYYNK